MQFSSINLFRALLMVVMQVALLSIFVSRADGSPVASRSGSDADRLLYFTQSKYCGRKLTEALEYLCQGRYPMMSNHRSARSTRQKWPNHIRHLDHKMKYLSDQPQSQVKVEVATLPDSGSHGFPHRRSHAHRRVRRAGIYDECCKKSCSYVELISYCD